MGAVEGHLTTPFNTRERARTTAWRFPVLAQRTASEGPRSGYWHVSACQ
jgi:hypothetical protein